VKRSSEQSGPSYHLNDKSTQFKSKPYEINIGKSQVLSSLTIAFESALQSRFDMSE